MYYKLPIKERMELMRSYKKANPNMSYHDMVKDYNTSYEKFGDGGKKEREPIITHDKNDSRLIAYQDSINAYNFNKKAFNKIIKENKTPKGKVISNDPPKLLTRTQAIQQEYDNQYYTKLSKDLISKDLEYYDPINKGTGKKMKAINYYSFNDYKDSPTYLLAQYKKPVQPYKYEPEPESPPTEVPPILPPIINSPPVKKDSIQYIPKQQVPSSDTTRHWNFNGSNPVMEYYDKSGKLINKEYYTGVNGKKIPVLNK